MDRDPRHCCSCPPNRHFVSVPPPHTHTHMPVHGLVGTPEDLTYLKESLERRGGEDVLVHLARCNWGKTKDGVAEGGSRLAEEVGIFCRHSHNPFLDGALA